MPTKAAIDIFRLAGYASLATNETADPITQTYWSEPNPPGEIWAFPHLLTMHKHESHKLEREYRFAFGTRADVFDFENVFGFVLPHDYVFTPMHLDLQAHRMKLYVGELADCCRILDRANRV